MEYFDDNFDFESPSTNAPQKTNMFSSLMGDQPQAKGATDDFPDFTTSQVKPNNTTNNAWDDEDIWNTNQQQQQAPDPGYGGGGFGMPDMAALRGNAKPEQKPPKPFHLDSMSISYFEKADEQAYKPQGYEGETVLNQSERFGEHYDQHQGMGQSYNNTQAQQYEENYGQNQDQYNNTQGQSYEGNYDQNQEQYNNTQEPQSGQQQNEYDYPASNDQYGHYDQHNQITGNQYGEGAMEQEQQVTNNYQDPSPRFQDNYDSQQRVTTNEYHSPLKSQYSENRMFVGGADQSNVGATERTPSPDHHYRGESHQEEFKIHPTSSTQQPVSLGLEIEQKGIQKPQEPKPESFTEIKHDHEQILLAEEAPKKESIPELPPGNPRALDTNGSTLDIKCSIHPGQYIERICTHAKYSRKRLLCWECGMDESREIQKYRHSLAPITQYALQNVQTYVNNEGPTIPANFQKSLSKLDSTRESFIQDLKTNIDSLRSSLDFMKQQIISKFEEIDTNLQEIATNKVHSLDVNKEFFSQALQTYYPSSSEDKRSRDSLLSSLSRIGTEKEFDEFISGLKPKADPATPEVRNYLRVLSHKIDSQELKYPSKENFMDLHTRNLKVMQLQEQILTNLDGIKGTLGELINSSYPLEDISKTRLVTPQNLTMDTLATLIPLNRVSHEQLRYRLQYEKKFSVQEPKRVTCIANIDNEIFAAGSLDKTISFWSIATGELLETIPAHDDSISGLYTYKVCMADLKNRIPQTNNFNEDSVTLLVSTGGKFDNTILFWDISWMHDYLRGNLHEKQNTKIIRRLEGHEAGITAVLPMIDGATLISGAYDGKITVWNTLKGKVVGEIHHHTAAVSCLRLMRDNERYASSSWDKTICIWRIFYKDLYDPDTGIHSDRRLFEGFEMEKIIDPSFKVMCMNSSLVNKSWLVFGGSINRVIVWDIDEGKLVKEFECENNNLAEIALVEDEQKEKMIIFGICDDDDVVRGWDTNYQESEGLLREAYNLKIRSKIYAAKTSVNGALLQLVQDGRLRMGIVNCAENKDLISLWELKLGV